MNLSALATAEQASTALLLYYIQVFEQESVGGVKD